MRALIGIAGSLSVAILVTQALAWDRFEDLSPPSAHTPSKGEQARFQHGMASLIAEDVATARRLLEPLANIGVTQAQVALGSILKRDPQAQKDALKWFYFAGNNGDEHGEYEVGRALADGKWIEQDLPQARLWLKKAAEKHYDEAVSLLNETDQRMLDLAKQAIDEKDFPRAESFLVTLAKDNNAYAQQLLGQVRANTEQVISSAQDESLNVHDFNETMRLLQKDKLNRNEASQVIEALQYAARPGNAEAQYQLGLLFLTGRIVNRNEKQGIYWYRLAADQGHSEAQYSLGVRYVLGQGTDQDTYEAHRWFKRAAENGNAKAQRNLALSYMHGIGTEKQLDKAQEWFNRASYTRTLATNSAPSRFANQNASYQSSTLIEKQDRPSRTTVAEPEAKQKQVVAKSQEKIRQDVQAATPIAKTIEGWDWFERLPQKGYTVQMMSALKPQTIQDFVRDHGLPKGRYLYHTEKIKSKSWHILHYGYFKTEKEAAEYASRISRNETDFKPIVRKSEIVKSHIEERLTTG